MKKKISTLIITLPFTLGFAIFLIGAASTTAHSQEIDDCIACHLDVNLVKTAKNGKVHSLFVDKAAFVKSVHGEMEYTCVDCHEDAKADSHPAEGLADVSCADCHEEVSDEHAKSKHGQQLKSGNADAPQCWDCHTMHAVLAGSEAASTVHPANLQKTCGTCHAAQAAPGLFELIRQFYQGKEEMIAPGLATTLFSVVPSRLRGHGKVDMACNYSNQNCADCHFEVLQHGIEDYKPKVCSNCHTMDRSTLLFGKIHKAGILNNPVLTILLIVINLAGLAGLAVFIKGTLPKKKPETPPEA